jgi:hypothetical protein
LVNIDRIGDDRGDKRTRDNIPVIGHGISDCRAPDASDDRADRTANNSTGDGAPETSSDSAINTAAERATIALDMRPPVTRRNATWLFIR